MKKYAVITGASSGIGREFAQLFAKDNVHLVLVARDEVALGQLAQELRTTYGVKALVHAADLSDISMAEGLYDFVKQKQLSVQYLINSAGFGDYDSVIEADWDKLQAMINLNITTLTYLSKVFAKDMQQQGSGRIVNLASIAAFLPGPNMAVYYATKAYVLRFSEALASELRSSGVTVTALCPGPTASQFATAAGAEKSEAFSGKLPTAHAVAAYGYRAMQAGKPVAIHSLKNRLLILLIRFAPRRLLIAAVRRAQG